LIAEVKTMGRLLGAKAMEGSQRLAFERPRYQQEPKAGDSADDGEDDRPAP
jgi:hypothetical protein